MMIILITTIIVLIIMVIVILFDALLKACTPSLASGRLSTRSFSTLPCKR